MASFTPINIPTRPMSGWKGQNVSKIIKITPHPTKSGHFKRTLRIQSFYFFIGRVQTSLKRSTQTLQLKSTFKLCDSNRGSHFEVTTALKWQIQVVFRSFINLKTSARGAAERTNRELLPRVLKFVLIGGDLETVSLVLASRLKEGLGWRNLFPCASIPSSN